MMYEAILFAPLCAAALVALGSRVLPRNIVHGLPILAVGLSAVLSIVALLEQLGGEPVRIKLLDWLSIGGFELSFGC